MAFNFTKEHKELYQPPKTPVLVEVPAMNFVAVRGEGNPNDAGGAYQRALAQLYGISYTLKMSYKGPHKIDGFFEYMVPPLEGFWWQEGRQGMDYGDKDSMRWISLIRLPGFVSQADFDWAVAEATRKKKQDFSGAEFLSYDEGLCVQCMHVGSYDDEPATIAAMDLFARQQGYEPDIGSGRYHHELYLANPRKTAPIKLRTVLRHPVKAVAG